MERLEAIAAIEEAGDSEHRALLVLARDNRPIAGGIADLASGRDWQIGGFAVERGRLDDVFRAITTPAADARA